MPKALDVDWFPIKAEFVTLGTPLVRLAEKYAVSYEALKQRAHREEWDKLRPKSQKEVDDERIAQLSRSVTTDWAAAGVKHREAMQRITARLVEHAENLDEDTLLAKVDKLRTVDDMARRNIGLDQPVNPTLTVAVGLLGGGDDPLESAKIVEIEPDRSLTDEGGAVDHGGNDDSHTG